MTDAQKCEYDECELKLVNKAVVMLTPTITIIDNEFVTRTPSTAFDIRQMLAARRAKGPGFLWDDVKAPSSFTEKVLLRAADVIDCKSHYDNWNVIDCKGHHR